MKTTLLILATLFTFNVSATGPNTRLCDNIESLQLTSDLEGRIGRYAGDSYTFLVEGQIKDERSKDDEKKGFCRISFNSIEQIEERFSSNSLPGKMRFKRELKNQANLKYNKLDANIEFSVRNGTQLSLRNCIENSNYLGSAGAFFSVEDILVSNIYCRQSLGSEELTVNELEKILGKKFKIITK